MKILRHINYLLRDNEIKMFTPYTPNTKIQNHFQITTPLLPSTNKNFLFLGSPNQIEYLDNISYHFGVKSIIHDGSINAPKPNSKQSLKELKKNL